MNLSEIETLFSPLKPKSPDSNERSDQLEHLYSSLHEIGYSPRTLQNFLKGADSRESTSILLHTLLDLSTSGIGWEEMAENIDDSSYSPTDWAKAMICFLNREGKNEKVDPASMIAYLCCTSEAAAHNPILLPFEELVEEMLDTFGYDGNR